MDLKIQGKTALITGGSKGIGYAIAKGLVAEGVRVAIGARDEAHLNRAIESPRTAGGGCGKNHRRD